MLGAQKKKTEQVESHWQILKKNFSKLDTCPIFSLTRLAPNDRVIKASQNSEPFPFEVASFCHQVAAWVQMCFATFIQHKISKILKTRLTTEDRKNKQNWNP
jgi:hypothetical protein